MRIDFYQLGRDPVDKVVTVLAGKVLDSGSRLLIVADDVAVRDHLLQSLWAADGFLANGLADHPHAERQPIVLSATCSAPNAAKMVILTDGKWREEARVFQRCMLLFDEAATSDARALWQQLSGSGDTELHIFKQMPEGGWREGA